jgi:hypothetical protein
VVAPVESVTESGEVKDNSWSPRCGLPAAGLLLGDALQN